MKNPRTTETPDGRMTEGELVSKRTSQEAEADERMRMARNRTGAPRATPTTPKNG